MTQGDRQIAFRRGFLRELANMGLTPGAAMDKFAELDVTKGLQGIASAIAGAVAGVPKLVGDTSRLATGLAVGVPLAAGASLGYLAGGSRGVSPEDVEALREQDLIDSYERATAKLRRRRELAATGGRHAR